MNILLDWCSEQREAVDAPAIVGVWSKSVELHVLQTFIKACGQNLFASTPIAIWFKHFHEWITSFVCRFDRLASLFVSWQTSNVCRCSFPAPLKCKRDARVWNKNCETGAMVTNNCCRCSVQCTALCDTRVVDTEQRFGHKYRAISFWESGVNMSLDSLRGSRMGAYRTPPPGFAKWAKVCLGPLNIFVRKSLRDFCTKLCFDRMAWVSRMVSVPHMCLPHT